MTKNAPQVGDTIATAAASIEARLTRERDDARESLAWWTEPQPCDLRHSEPFDFGSCETHDRTFPLGGTCDHAGLSEVEWMEQREHQQRQRAIRAEQERDEARAESDETHAILERLSDLLTRTVNTLRGDPPPLVAWSWHDIPDLAAQRVAAIARIEATCGYAEQAGASPWIHTTTIRQAIEALA